MGRSQEVLYFLGKHYKDWGLGNWEVFLDSPMAIEATEVYLRHSELFNDDAFRAWKQNQEQPLLPNLHFSRTPLQSMKINQIDAGALIVNYSGHGSFTNWASERIIDNRGPLYREDVEDQLANAGKYPEPQKPFPKMAKFSFFMNFTLRLTINNAITAIR